MDYTQWLTDVDTGAKNAVGVGTEDLADMYDFPKAFDAGRTPGQVVENIAASEDDSEFDYHV